MQTGKKKKCLVVGGGMAGMAVAYWLKTRREKVEVDLLEREAEVMSWVSGKRGREVVVGPTGEMPAALEESGMVERAAAMWPARETVAWLRGLGVSLREGDGVWRASGEELRERLLGALEEAGVEVRCGHAVESLRKQPDGSFRLWGHEGDLGEGGRVVLATGGERNHGMALAREMGLEVAAVRAGYVRLKPAARAVARQLSGLERKARVVFEKSGEAATGMVRFGERGLEGAAISELAVPCGEEWGRLRHRLRILVDWVPDWKPGEVARAVEAQAVEAGRRPVGEDPLFGFGVRHWQWFLKKAGLDGETSWARTQPRKRQRLGQLLKRQVVLTDGMGLPEGERAWAGGVVTEGLVWETGEARAVPGLHVAGEMLDFLLPPGGWQPAAVWASAYLVATGPGGGPSDGD